MDGVALCKDGSDFFVWDLTRGCEGGGREERFELRRGGYGCEGEEGRKQSISVA